MKKLVSTVMTMFLLLSTTMTVFAATGNSTTNVDDGKITIGNVEKGETYSIYRIFDLESFSTGEDTQQSDVNNETEAYSYKISTKWTGFEKSKVFTEYFDLSNGYVFLKDGVSKDEAGFAKFAAEALEYAEVNGIAADEQTKAVAETVVFDGLPLGYYLVDSSLGVLCNLTTTDFKSEVVEKNSKPTLEKLVKEDLTGEWGESDHADIDDVVEFKAIITVAGYAKDYIMHDKMSEGLDFNAVTEIKLNNETIDTSSYNVIDEVPCGIEGCTFDVVFTDTFCESLKSGDVIEVYYNATVNEKAIVKDEGNPNEACLEYTENYETSSEKTPWDKTITYTFEIEVLKYVNGKEKNKLAGAGFTLYRNEECTTAITVATATNADGTYIDNVYKVDKTGDKTEIFTDKTGVFQIEGLDADTYYLKETTVPTGYNKLEEIVKVEIDNDGNVKIGDIQVDQIKIENIAGMLLPSTGGMGTTMLYIVGGVLVLAAVVLMVMKNRTRAEK